MQSRKLFPFHFCCCSEVLPFLVTLLTKVHCVSKNCNKPLCVIAWMQFKAVFVCAEVISSRMPMNSCVTYWTTSTGSYSTAVTGRLIQSHLRMESDSLVQMANAARESF